MTLSASEEDYGSSTEESPQMEVKHYKTKLLMIPKRCRNVSPGSGHVRSASMPLTMSPSRTFAAGLPPLFNQLVTSAKGQLLKSTSMPILSVQGSSLALPRRIKTIILISLLAMNYLAYMLLCNTTITIKHPYTTNNSQLSFIPPRGSTEYINRFFAQYAKHSFCPSNRSPDFSINLGFRNSNALTKIGIVLAITSKSVDEHNRVHNITKHNMVSVMPTFRSLLPSFCRTASFGHDYHFFFGYDINDVYFTRPDFRSSFASTILRMITLYCPGGSSYALHFVQCTHTRHVSWAQNDAVMEAYLSGMEYFYRINDDTVFETPGWTEAFIWHLGQLDPPNIGIVGPNHQGGNYRILTYEFVHRLHVEIMGYHYPRQNGDWDDDVWITKVYRPSRSRKVPYIHLTHTQEQGRRYEVNTMVEHVRRKVMMDTKATVQRYIRHKRAEIIDPDPRKVIAMSVKSNDPVHLWGAIRNAQLRKIIYPDWTLRVYVACDVTPRAQHEGFASDLNRVLKTLSTLGADVRMVGDDVARVVPSSGWHLLALDDDELDHVLFRNPDERFSDRDRRLVNKWMKLKNDTAARVHCIRDHPSHVKHPMVHGLWGTELEYVKTLIGNSIKSLLMDYAKNYTEHSFNFGQGFLTDVLWPRVENATVCHDSVTCKKWNNSVFFSEHRGDVGFLGRKYNEHEEYLYPFDMIPFEDLNTLECREL